MDLKKVEAIAKKYVELVYQLTEEEYDLIRSHAPLNSPRLKEARRLHFLYIDADATYEAMKHRKES